MMSHSMKRVKRLQTAALHTKDVSVAPLILIVDTVGRWESLAKFMHKFQSLFDVFRKIQKESFQMEHVFP